MDKKMTQLGKMFTYIALIQIRHHANKKQKVAMEYDAGTTGSKKLVDELVKLGVVKIVEFNGDKLVCISKDGGKLVARYFAACADELARGRFGKMKWDKRSKFHKELMARIA